MTQIGLRAPYSRRVSRTCAGVSLCAQLREELRKLWPHGHRNTAILPRFRRFDPLYAQRCDRRV